MIQNTEKKPTVDVIIPTWNRGPMLERAVGSVLMQGESVQKIIVVDNGSVRARLNLTDDRIVLIQAEISIGASAARNIGVFESNADYVAFLDDDDYWKPDFLSSMSGLLKSDVDIVVGSLMREAEGGEPRKYKLIDDTECGLRKLYYKNPGFGGQNIVVKRDFFIKIGGFDTEMPASNDRDFAVRAIQSGGVIKVQPSAVAVLCDHANARVRHKQVIGNYRFIVKHWRFMNWFERFFAIGILTKRYIISRINNLF